MSQLAWRYRLFRRPRLPTEMRAAAQDADVLSVVEGASIAVHQRIRRMPGVRGARGTQLIAGGAVLLRDRALLSAGSALIVDCRLGDPGAAGQTIAFATDGIRLALDVAPIYGGDAAGHVELHYRIHLDATLLGALAHQSSAVRLIVAVPGVMPPLP